MLGAGLGAGAILLFGGYRFFTSTDAAAAILPVLDERTNEVIDRVRQADDNNQERLEALRGHVQSQITEGVQAITGEGRANFELLANQLYCMQQVQIQTLQAVADATSNSPRSTPGHTTGEGTTPGAQNALKEFATKAQEATDKIMDDTNVKDTRKFHTDTVRSELRASIGGQEPPQPLVGSHQIQNVEPRRREPAAANGGYGTMAALGASVLAVGSMFMGGKK